MNRILRNSANARIQRVLVGARNPARPLYAHTLYMHKFLEDMISLFAGGRSNDIGSIRISFSGTLHFR